MQSVRKAKGTVAGAGRADPQKDRLYDFEGEWVEWNTNRLPLADCRAIIRSACEHYGVKTPRVTQHFKRSFSWYSPDDNWICLQAKGAMRTSGKNAATALHEAAHAIVWQLFGYTVADHGPTFLGIFMALLERAAVAPVEALHAAARKHKLKWRKCRI